MASRQLGGAHNAPHREPRTASLPGGSFRARDGTGSRLLLQQDVVDGQYVVQLFKALKQNWTVKSFVGTSENALPIQIWTALIAMLLLKWRHHLSKANWSLSNWASMLRLNLFTYRELTKWLHNPMETPPLLPVAEQLSFFMS
jgi:hypothetical protein